MHPDSEELLYCTAGSGTIMVHREGDGKIVAPFTPGTGVLVPMGAEHRIVNNSEAEQLCMTYTLVPPKTAAQFVAKEE